LDVCSDANKENKRQFRRTMSDTFNEIQFRIELLTRDGKVTPEINDYTLIYDEEPYV
jgi:hypothetical protein